MNYQMGFDSNLQATGNIYCSAYHVSTAAIADT